MPKMILNGKEYGISNGNSITYGTIAPSSAGNDGDMYIMLDSNNQYQKCYLYIRNTWTLINESGGSQVQEQTIEWSNERFGGQYGHPHGISNVDLIQVVDAWYDWGNGWVNSLSSIGGYNGTYTVDSSNIYFSYDYFDAQPYRKYKVKVKYTTL